MRVATARRVGAQPTKIPTEGTRSRSLLRIPYSLHDMCIIIVASECVEARGCKNSKRQIADLFFALQRTMVYGRVGKLVRRELVVDVSGH